MYKISVIIPIYNEEKTLHYSVDSILNQKWNGNIIDDIEIILVDDCSMDNSKVVMEDYSRKYSNIKVFSTEENIGSPAIARNIGIKNSSSEYLMFLDGDDEYCEDMCQTLFNTITEENVDVVTCNWYFIIDSKFHKMEFDINAVGERVFFDSNHAISSALAKNDWMIWKAIYRKSMLLENNIVFPSKVCEDTFFLFDVFRNMCGMIYLKDFYGVKKQVRGDSISTGANVKNILNYLTRYTEVDELFYSLKIKKNYHFDFFKHNLNSTLVRIIKLNDVDEMNICLNKLYECETRIQFDNSITIKSFYDIIIKLINFFILKDYRKLTILLIKLCKLPYRIFK